MAALAAGPALHAACVSSRLRAALLMWLLYSSYCFNTFRHSTSVICLDVISSFVSANWPFYLSYFCFLQLFPFCASTDNGQHQRREEIAYSGGDSRYNIWIQSYSLFWGVCGSLDVLFVGFFFFLVEAYVCLWGILPAIPDSSCLIQLFENYSESHLGDVI